MRLDEVYLDEDINSRGSESDGGDEDNSSNVSDGPMSVDSGNDSNSDGGWWQSSSPIREMQSWCYK